MRTPAGTECTFFEGDYYRGRNREACRLLYTATPPQHWTRDLCRKCPVPGIQQANSCGHMALTAKVSPGVFRLGRHVVVQAYCHKAGKAVEEPHIGCGICHPLPDGMEILEPG